MGWKWEFPNGYISCPCGLAIIAEDARIPPAFYATIAHSARIENTWRRLMTHARVYPGTRILFPCAAAMIFIVCGCAPGAAIDPATGWNQWGGPARNFNLASSNLTETWPADGPRRIWERDIKPGYSAIVSDGTRLFTMYRDGDDEIITALSPTDGRTLFEHRYAAPPFDDQVKDFGLGPNATPLVTGGRVVTVGFTGKMHCLDAATGKHLWAHDLVAEFGGKQQKFGYSASPLRYGNHIITLVGGDNGVIAFNLDGRVAWKSDPLDISYASPIVINVDGQDQIAFFGSSEIMGIDAQTGRLEWRAPCENRYKNNCSDPLFVKGNLLWATTQLDGGTRMLQLSRVDGTTHVKELWRSNKIRLFHWNAVWSGDHIYATIGDTTTPLVAIEALTGQIAWRQRGFSKSKMVRAGDKLIALDDDGKLALVHATPTGAEVLATTQLFDDTAWTPPTLIGNTLYVRDNKRIMALHVGG